MHTAIVLLALGLAVAAATGSLADHAELIANRNLAADRAERAVDSFIHRCGSTGCNPQVVNADRADGTVLSGCVYQSSGASVLRVDASIDWDPRVFTGLTPVTATAAVDLGGFGPSAAASLKRC